MTLKLEYVHVDFGSKRYVDPPISGAVTRDVRLTDDIVRAGVNVRFNWDRPVSRSTRAAEGPAFPLALAVLQRHDRALAAHRR